MYSRKSQLKTKSAVIPGETRSYFDIAQLLGKKTAYRAVGQANGANQIAIFKPQSTLHKAKQYHLQSHCGLPHSEAHSRHQL